MSIKAKDTRNGIQRISNERQRQISSEGYDKNHDLAEHGDDDSLAMAAACYAAPERIYIKQDFANGMSFADPWPWADHYDKRPCNGNEVTPEKATKAQRIRLLEKAGALIAAEIDNLLSSKK
jgi:hypothetical protein